MSKEPAYAVVRVDAWSLEHDVPWSQRVKVVKVLTGSSFEVAEEEAARLGQLSAERSVYFAQATHVTDGMASVE